MTAPAAHPASRLRAADVTVGCRIRHTATAASAGVYPVTKCERVWTGMGERIRITFAVMSRNGVAFESSVLVKCDEMVELVEAEIERE